MWVCTFFKIVKMLDEHVSRHLPAAIKRLGSVVLFLSYLLLESPPGSAGVKKSELSGSFFF